MQERGIPVDLEELRRGSNPPSTGSNAKKFNAFHESNTNSLSDSKSNPKSKGAAKEERTIHVPYGGETIAVNADGSLVDEDVKYPKGSVIKVEGLGDGDRGFGSMKVCDSMLSSCCYSVIDEFGIQTSLKTVFSRPPHIKIAEGTSTATFIFNTSVTDEDLEKLKTSVPKLADGTVTYARADGIS